MSQIDYDNDNADELKGQLTTYLRYGKLKDMLKVKIYSAQSTLGLTPIIYHINYNNQQILFRRSNRRRRYHDYYIVQNNNEKSIRKFIGLKRLTGQFSFVDSIRTDTRSIYLPILKVENSTFKFPI